MRLKVIWSDFAANQLDDIFEYYNSKAGYTIAARIVTNIILSSDRLNENPYIGAIEPFLIHRTETYRFIVYTNYKIVYSVDEINGFVKIADIFDTRQNPVKLQRN